MLRLATSFIIFLTISLPGLAQNTIALPAVHNFSKEAYRAGMQNWDIRQDPLGNLYMANNEGLLVYDGSRWQLYPILEGKSIVRSIALTKAGRIYAGGQDELGYFQPNETGKLSYHSLIDKVPSKHRNMSDVWDIVEYKDAVFFRSFSSIFQYENEVMTTYSAKEEWLYLGSCNHQLFAQDSKQGLMKLERDGWYPVLFDKGLPTGALITAILPASNKSMLITTLKHGIFRWQGKQVTPLAAETQSIWQTGRVYTAIPISQGRYALGTSLQGLYIIDEEGHLVQHMGLAEGLQNSNILTVFADREENLWLGLDNGIDCVAFSNAIRQVNPFLQTGSGYAAVQFNDQLFLGTSGGLYQTTLEKGKDLAFSRGSFRVIPQANGQIWGLAVINNRVLLGHHEGAFLIENGQLQPLAGGTGYWHFIPLQETYPSEKIIAGNYKGVSIVNYSDGRFQSLAAIPGFTESSRYLAIDGEENIWVSHPYHGVFRIQPKTGGQYAVQLFSEKQGLPQFLNNQIFKVRHEILAATERGIYRYVSAKQQFEPAADYQKWLGNQSVRYLKEDTQGNVWFVHEKQIGVIDFSGKAPKAQWLPELERRILSGFEMIYPIDAQHVLIGAEKGFFLVNLKQYQQQHTPIEVQIRGVHLIDAVDSLVVGGYSHLLPIAAASLPNHSVRPHWKSIRIEFAAAYYGNHTGLEYSYRLKGFDKEWSTWSKRTEKEYTNLPAGNYIFEVKARRGNQLESPICTYRFEVLPPWYKSRIAYLVYVLLLSAFIYFLFKWQQQKFLKQQQLHEKEQQRLKYIHELEKNKAESELVALRNEKLESEINFKNSEMAASAMHLVKKGDLLQTMRDELNRLMKMVDQPKAVAEIKNIIKKLSEDDNFDQEWDQFSKHFDKVHSDFVVALKEKHADLTPNEVKLCIYLRMNLTTKEIAQLMNISVRGVEISRYRLRKKLKLPTEVNLFDYLIQIKQ